MTAPARRDHVPQPVPPCDRLRELARQVEALGTAGRTDPETILLSKLSVAAELRALARALEAGR